MAFPEIVLDMPRQSENSCNSSKVIRHAPLVCGEVIAAFGAFATGSSNYQVLIPLGFSALGVIFIGAHILVAKYGDISAVAAKIKEATKKLLGDIRAMASTNEELNGEINHLQAIREELIIENNGQKASLAELSESIETLQKEKTELGEQLLKFNQLSDLFTTKTAEVNNSRLKAEAL